MQGSKGLLCQEVLSGEGTQSLGGGGGCGKAAKSEVTQGKQMVSCFFWGPSPGTRTGGGTEVLESTEEDAPSQCVWTLGCC